MAREQTQDRLFYYWFDSDHENLYSGTLSNGQWKQSVDVSHLQVGLHTIYLMATGNDGLMSSPVLRQFYKIDKSSDGGLFRCLYYVDGQMFGEREIPACGGILDLDLDVSCLSEGVHRIQLQVMTEAGVVSGIHNGFFLRVGTKQELGQLTCLCYVDGELFSKDKMSAEGGLLNMNLDANSLSEGLHQIQLQIITETGILSGIYNGFFFRVPTQEEYNQFTCLCYVDGELFSQEKISAEGSLLYLDLDVNGLAEGIHRIQLQVITKTGVTSSIYNGVFLRVPTQEEYGQFACMCYIDGEFFSQEKFLVEGGLLNMNFDTNSLSEGLHRIQLQVITESGIISGVYNGFFIRVSTSKELSNYSCMYVLDDDTEAHKVSLLASDETCHFDIDMSMLSDGLHHISYFLSSDKGATSSPVTRFFIKSPIGGTAIARYQYWLNDDAEHMKTVTLPEAQNPFKLISLLPIEKVPLRSRLFHFEVKDGKPMMYAKNDIHFRFHDKSGRWVDADKQYVDFSVKQEVEPVDELQATQTFPKVAENDIRWYTMQVAPGDTAAFKLSQAATLQVFAPSGKEVFKTSESASVQWAGIHTWEDGTYYVAVHDVTGSRSNMTLDYMHMDKYDIVDWDVHTVGNGGCSTITFKGNGFRDLYAVDLYTAAGDSIHSVDISHESDAETAVTFDFSGAELGVYNAVFHFTQEDKHFANIVTVEEAVDIELATNVSFPSTFLRGTSTTYTIKITNKGNMTAYNVPIYIYIPTKSVDDISRLSLKGLDLQPLYDFMDTGYWTEEERREMKEYSDKVGEEHYFYIIKMFDNDLRDSVVVRKAYLFVTISPNITKQFTLTLHAQQKVDAYFTIPTEWNSLTEKEASGDALIRRKRIVDKYCCYHDGFECALNSFAYTMSWTAIIGLAAGQAEVTAGAELAGCISSGISALSNIGATFACDRDRKLWGDKLGFGKIMSWAGTAGGCMTGALKAAKEVKSAISFGLNQVQMSFNLADCTKAGKNPNCPPGPQGGGTSTPQPPSDPNDIYGYLSDAGSKFMTDDVAKVNYTIEFENDTAFAQASAHTIVIRDTLDSRYFDLKSFLPTSVKIGEREAFLDEATDIKTSGSVTSFLKTIDMRPEINAIAQVEGEYRQQTGIAKWTFTSLDPMTMEPTDDLMQGILPVNYNGTSGIGEVMFEVGVKPNKGDGTQIPNRASIVFDYEEPILSPTWTNIVDATAPESHIADVQMATDSTATVRIEATDELSGPWRYDVYVQYGSGAWFKAAENVPIDTTASVKVYEGINHGFYVVVTDSAGNVEQKNAEREFTFEVFGSQIDTDSRIELAEGWNWMSHNQEEPLMVAELQSAGSRMLGQTEELYEDARFGWMGDLEELLPTQMYKLQMDGPLTVQLSGRLFNAGFRAVPLYEGWNWMGYPVARTMTPAEALAKLEAEEGDMLIGQDGMATYSDGQWTGTLMEMNPGQGYMFRSQSDKNLFLNATAQASSRRANSPRHSSLPDDWTVNKRKYPNVMGMIAQLWHDDALADSGEWQLGAFCGDECRGVAQTVGDGEPTQTVLMMNVYGTGSEPISFRVMNRETGEVLDAAEQESFRADVIGSMQQPYALHIGEKTGVRYVTNDTQQTQQATYDLQGRRVEAGQAAKGIYVVADGKKNKTQKVVKR